MLTNLGEHGGEWYAGCGRYWKSDRQDPKVYRALVERGFVEEREVILLQHPRSVFRMTQAGREWYLSRTGKRVQRRPFAKITDPYEEGEPLENDAQSPVTETEPTTEFDEYSVRDDGIQGWTVSVDIDTKSRRTIEEGKVWWVAEWGFDEAKLRAGRHADYLNGDGSIEDKTVLAIAVPIMIAPYQA
jgi:hypothetical protein